MRQLPQSKNKVFFVTRFFFFGGEGYYAHGRWLCRCDILSDAEPPSCQHCKQYNFECTFFLPITETRFKKKKTEENIDHQEKEKSTTRDTLSPHGETKRDQDPSVFGMLKLALLS